MDKEKNFQTNKSVPEDVSILCNSNLLKFLWLLVLEVRKVTGSEYPPQTLHHIMCRLIWHLRQYETPELDFFQDTSAFTDFQCILDTKMKQLKQTGVSSHTKQAKSLTATEEKMLWKTGAIENHSPWALLSTVFYMYIVLEHLHSRVVRTTTKYGWTSAKYKWYRSLGRNLTFYTQKILHRTIPVDSRREKLSQYRCFTMKISPIQRGAQCDCAGFIWTDMHSKPMAMPSILSLFRSRKTT